MIGCGADQNPYPRRTEELAKYHGRTLALAVEAALETVPKPLRGPLRTAFEDVTLDFAPVPPREELEKTAATGKEPHRGHAARLLKQLKENGKIRSTYPCPVQVVRFGSDLTLVAIGGETVRRLLAAAETRTGRAERLGGRLLQRRVRLPALAARAARGRLRGGRGDGLGFAAGPVHRDGRGARRLQGPGAGAARRSSPCPAAVDLKIGQQAAVKLCDGNIGHGEAARAWRRNATACATPCARRG